MKKHPSFCLLTFSLVLLALAGSDGLFAQPGKALLTMDMVHNNPGEAPTISKFTDPAFLKKEGYGAKVFFLFEAAQFGINWKPFDASIFPDSTASGKWVQQKYQTITRKYSEVKAAGLNVYCMLDMLVLPSNLVKKRKAEICDSTGKIDIRKPFTQQCIRALMNQMFDAFPQLDGLVIRTGETYLQDAPYYTGNNPVLHGISDHIILISLLRDEVCVKRNKKLFYRTWDISKLHALPQYYRSVTDSIEPHPNLYFSIKHTIVDFWRSAPQSSTIDYSQYKDYWINESTENGIPFNPNIGTGRNKQIVEVQCAREYEGKGAHPNYIAKGVIDGFDELKAAHMPHPYCLNDIKNDSLFSGVWTWSRGGGWGGPYIKNELWCELNAYVVTQWAKNPSRSEEAVFNDFCKEKGLSRKDTKIFREICLSSAKAVMQGQYSEMGGVTVVWSRDNTFNGMPLLQGAFDKIIKAGKMEAYLQEKANAVALWKKMEGLSKQLHFKDSLSRFIQTSVTYGRYKYEIIEKGWNIMMRSYAMEKSNSGDKAAINYWIEKYDALWAEWKTFAVAHSECPSLYKDADEGWSMARSVNEVRKKLADKH